MTKTFMLSMVFSTLLLSACGGSGGSSSNDATSGGNDPTSEPEPGTQEFAADIAYAATETTKSAVTSQNVPTIPFSAQIPSNGSALEQFAGVAQGAASQTGLQQLAAAAKIDETGNCGGRLVAEISEPTSFNFPITTTYSGEFFDYCVSSGSLQIIYDGTMSGSTTQINNRGDATVTVTYDLNFSFTNFDENFAEDYVGTVSCRTSNQQITCTQQSNYTVGSTTYRFDSGSISGNASSGYNLSGTLDDGKNSFGIEVTGLTQCSNGNIEQGTIAIAVNDSETITATFPNCNEFVVTYQGVANTYPQNPTF